MNQSYQINTVKKTKKQFKICIHIRMVGCPLQDDSRSAEMAAYSHFNQEFQTPCF